MDNPAPPWAAAAAPGAQLSTPALSSTGTLSGIAQLRALEQKSPATSLPLNILKRKKKGTGCLRADGY